MVWLEAVLLPKSRPWGRFSWLWVLPKLIKVSGSFVSGIFQLSKLHFDNLGLRIWLCTADPCSRIGPRIVIFQFSSNCSIALVHCYLFIICLPIFGNVLLILAKAHVLHWGTIFGKFYATWNRALIAFEALLNLPWIWFTMGKYIHKKKAGLSGIIFNRAE